MTTHKLKVKRKRLESNGLTYKDHGFLMAVVQDLLYESPGSYSVDEMERLNRIEYDAMHKIHAWHNWEMAKRMKP